MDLKKEINLNKNFIIIIIFINVIVLVLYYSYALFETKVIKENVVIIKTPTINITTAVTGENVSNNTFTISGNSEKQITINLTSNYEPLNTYKVYYKIISGENNIRLKETDVSPIGKMNTTKTIVCTIKNIGSNDIKIEIGTKGGLVGYEIQLDEGQYSLFKTDIEYTGDAYEYIIPMSGTYKIELWGASGGENVVNSAGLGGYTSGNIELNKNTNLYFYVGNKGTRWTDEKQYNRGYNGGEYGEARGGGGTDVRLIAGVFDNFNSLKSRIMVAAGGGGGQYTIKTFISSGTAGGLIGYDALNSSGNGAYSGHGATQISGGSTGDNTLYNACNFSNSISCDKTKINGRFGLGGYIERKYNQNNSIVEDFPSSSGGGGYFGGGHGIHPGNDWTGGGGSSFISGHAGCIAITEDSTEDNIMQRKDSNNNTCIENTTDITCSYHYSDYKFTDTVMIDGRGYKWTTIKENEIVGMPSPNGGTEIGHTGDGYARITLVDSN